MLRIKQKSQWRLVILFIIITNWISMCLMINHLRSERMEYEIIIFCLIIMMAHHHIHVSWSSQLPVVVIWRKQSLSCQLIGSQHHVWPMSIEHWVNSIIIINLIFLIGRRSNLTFVSERNDVCSRVDICPLFLWTSVMLLKDFSFTFDW